MQCPKNLQIASTDDKGRVNVEKPAGCLQIVNAKQRYVNIETQNNNLQRAQCGHMQKVRKT